MDGEAGDSCPQDYEAGWGEVRRLVALAREAGCADEAHFFPLEQLAPLRATLHAHQHAVPSLVRLLTWASPQHPLHQRTRAKQQAGSTPGGAYVAGLVEQLKASPLGVSPINLE